MDAGSYIGEPDLYRHFVRSTGRRKASIRSEYRNVVLNRINGACLIFTRHSFRCSPSTVGHV